MSEMIKKVSTKIVWYLDQMLGPGAAISFGRVAALVSLLYFLGQDAWYFHRTGRLVDVATLAAHNAFALSWYGVNKYSEYKIANPSCNDASNVDQKS